MTTATPDFDAIVVGLGFAGIYQLHTLRDQLGLRVRGYDTAGGVGGTWYWNRYPGATSDTESPFYRYSFDEELLQAWSWQRRYLTQPEILEYLEAVVDRYDLRKDIQLTTAVESLVFDEVAELWSVRTSHGDTITARYVITALGNLAATNLPDLPGRERFQGTIVHTARWPSDLSLADKRVGVIGTGSTGTQLVIAAAETASHLTVFQRTAQYCVPSGDRPVTADEIAEVKANFGPIWEQVRASSTAFGFDESSIETLSVSDKEREAVFEAAWERGNGFYFMFGTFGDILTNVEANEAAASFIRRKIHAIVKDPETARTLTPTDLYARRPVCNSGYYDVFNRENVSLVSVKENPIVEVTSSGVMTADGTLHELDVLVFATGFDAVDGNYRRLDLQGRSGITIAEHWGDEPRSYLGIATSGFPNLFMVLGPYSPFTSHVPAIETQVEFITELLRAARAGDKTLLETSPDAENAWTSLCRTMAQGTLLSKVDSWISGGNIDGKPKVIQFYVGGLSGYRAVLEEEARSGYADFK